ncbi:MAG TPA: killer suppression protein HigA [Candidatus Dormibacteraeota bacterium]|nr:killer suppression protein HigA [Candidatus Dormibacteraeota bacterium]
MVVVILDITFADGHIQKVCNDDRLGRRRYGKLWPKLKQRLAELRACNVVTDMRLGRPHPLMEDRRGQYAVHVTGKDCLVFAAVDAEATRGPDGEVDWAQVTAIEILEVTDYHAHA